MNLFNVDSCKSNKNCSKTNIYSWQKNSYKILNLRKFLIKICRWINTSVRFNALYLTLYIIKECVSLATLFCLNPSGYLQCNTGRKKKWGRPDSKWKKKTKQYLFKIHHCLCNKLYRKDENPPEADNEFYSFVGYHVVFHLIYFP